jgi:hypothetical protein
MMSRLYALLIAISCCLALAVPEVALAQGPPATTDRRVTLYELVLRDGSRMFGTIESQDETQVVFKTQAGATVTAKRTEIASLHQVTGQVVNGEFLPPDPNATRLFFGPTGRSLAKRQTYLGVFEFVMPFVQVGITDRLSIGGGTPLVFGMDESDRPFWVTPKLQLVNSGGTQIAAGVFHVFDTRGDGGGVGYLVGTHGNNTASWTVGGGLAYGNRGGRSGVLMVGGERQVRRNLKLISENYLWKSGDGVASAGVRFFGERLSADLAFAIPIGTDSALALPVLNFVYVF